MNSFVITAFCAILAVADGGLIGSGLVSPIGLRTISTGIALGLESTVVAGPSGTIVNNRNIALSYGVGLVRSCITTTGLVDNVGLLHGGVISAPGVIAPRSLSWNGLGLNGFGWNGGLIRSALWVGAQWNGTLGLTHQLW